ncbi:MAG: SbcC/MukB-like Walker B domain-containing protein, partial [Methanobacteriota archaeon]
ARDRLAALRLEAARIQGDLARVADEELRLAREEEEARAIEARRAACDAEMRLLARLAGDRETGLLVDFKTDLIGRIRPNLARAAGDLLRETTRGRYAGCELSDDYELSILDEGEAFPLERFSGGERDLANLCLRLALGGALAERAGSVDFQFLALDEVFGSQDEERRLAILSALAALQGRFRQILLVTHIEDVKDHVEHVLRVETAEDGTSRVVVP